MNDIFLSFRLLELQNFEDPSIFLNALKTKNFKNLKKIIFRTKKILKKLEQQMKNHHHHHHRIKGLPHRHHRHQSSQNPQK